MLDRVVSLPGAWWSRVTRAKGATKIVWGCLPVVVLFTCCIGGTAVGQSAGLIAVPPTRTPGQPAATATPRLASNTPTSAPAAPAEPTAAPAAQPTAAPDATAAAPASQPGDESYPCAPGQIKGNRDSKIYHVPGGASYAQTQENVRCFDTGAEAEAEGYRAARN